MVRQARRSTQSRSSAASDVYKRQVGVTLGAIVGHTTCALIAIAGSKLIAGHISEQAIAGVGGALFLIFATIALWEGV